jgi:hypothetical protein
MKLMLSLVFFLMDLMLKEVLSLTECARLIDIGLFTVPRSIKPNN